MILRNYFKNLFQRMTCNDNKDKYQLLCLYRSNLLHKCKWGRTDSATVLETIGESQVAHETPVDFYKGCNYCTRIYRKEYYLWSIQSGSFIPLDTGKDFLLVWNTTTGEGFWPTEQIPEENKRVIRKLGNITCEKMLNKTGCLIWRRGNWGNVFQI